MSDVLGLAVDLRQHEREPMSADWKPAQTAPQDIVVQTKVHDQHGERNVQPLKRVGNLWFFPDEHMYVYYDPTHWRPLPYERPQS